MPLKSSQITSPPPSLCGLAVVTVIAAATVRSLLAHGNEKLSQAVLHFDLPAAVTWSLKRGLS